MSKKIHCIGSLSLDVFYPYPEFDVRDTPGDTLSKQKVIFEMGAKYRSRDRFEAPGGCATNVSQGLARLGIDAGLVAYVGRDDMGTSLVKEISSEGVNVDLVRYKEGCKTDLASIVVDERTGERIIFYNRDANEDFSLPEEIAFDEGSIFVSGLYGDWQSSLRTIQEKSREKACCVFYNPSQSNIESDPKAVWEMCLLSQGVFLNKDEAMELLTRLSSGEDAEVHIERDRLENEEYLATVMASFGGERFVVITDGPRGAWVYDRSSDAVLRQEGKAVSQVVDATGAGDAFTSGFLGAVLLGKDKQTALSWGIANATSVIAHYGGKSGLLRVNEIEN